MRVLIPALELSASYCGCVAVLACEQTPADDYVASERRHTRKMSRTGGFSASACGGSGTSG